MSQTIHLMFDKIVHLYIEEKLCNEKWLGCKKFLFMLHGVQRSNAISVL